MLNVSPLRSGERGTRSGFDLGGPTVCAFDQEPWPMTADATMLEEPVRRLDDTGVSALSVEDVRLGQGTVREDYEQALGARARIRARHGILNVDNPEI